MTREQAQATLLLTANAIVEAVEALPRGCPAGHMYAALMQTGMDLDTFELITSTLVEMGKIRREGDQFFPVRIP